MVALRTRRPPLGCIQAQAVCALWTCLIDRRLASWPGDGSVWSATNCLGARDTNMDILQRLDEAGAVYLNRHFIYTSGKHGSGYINLDHIFTDVGLVSDLCKSLIEPFSGQVDTVVAPATGGIML